MNTDTKLQKIDIGKELNKISPRQWNSATLHYLNDMKLNERLFNTLIDYINNMDDELLKLRHEIEQLKKYNMSTKP
jgi:hypothetical protein